MTNLQEPKRIFDLEERCLEFALETRRFIASLPYNEFSIDDKRQLLRSSGSVGANYIEANEGLGKKDFVMQLKISRKEAKESRQWLHLLSIHVPITLQEEHVRLINECTELIKILSSIIKKFK